MTNEDITKELTQMQKNFDSNSVYGSYCIDCLDAAIEALNEQPKHSQNTSSKQPDLETLGVKTVETCEDVISRRDAIDAVEFGITYAKVLNKETGEVMELFKKSNEELQKAVDRIEALPSAQPEIIHCKDCKHSEHWYRDKARCFLWHEQGIDVFEDGYCNYAERKEGDTDG